MPDMSVLGPVIGVAAVILFTVIGIVVARSMKGGGYMGKINNQYANLAATLGLPPPVPSPGYPSLTIDSGTGLAITIRPVTHYHRDNASGFSSIPSRLLESPYDGLDETGRARAAAGAQVAETLLSMAGRGSSCYARNRRVQAEQLTEVTLAMPARFLDTKILLVPETPMGALSSLGEIRIEDREFDKEFKVKGMDGERIRALLTPELRQALLAFVRTHGRIQVNENAVVWVHHGLATDKVPGVVTGLKHLAHALAET